MILEKPSTTQYGHLSDLFLKDFKIWDKYEQDDKKLNDLVFNLSYRDYTFLRNYIYLKKIHLVNNFLIKNGFKRLFNK